MFTLKNLTVVLLCCAFPAVLSAQAVQNKENSDVLKDRPEMKKTAVDAPVKADEHKKNGQKTDKTVDAQKDKKVPVKEEKKQEATVVPYKNWLTNMEAARLKAKKENKTILVALVGNPAWDGNSAALAEEVFNREIVVNTLSKEYILVKIAFPKNSKDLTPAERREYTLFRRKYAPTESTPAVVLLIDRNGNLIGKIALDASTISRIKAAGYLKMINEASQTVGSRRILRR